PKLDLIENVELPMIYAGIPRRERNERAMAALESVGLMPWIKHKPNEVSGGQKQRAAIARSIVMKPALLIADEPTGNLDTKSSKEIMDIFTELNRRGATIILITHEDDIAAYAKRIIRIVDGIITSDKAVG
ncbi:MAG: ATP-binding cassette domain-containing protein, partial [Eubacteriales bacterium]|nr:ATP-binding cassette domain-containing protein [Eubacteriales bacterium]